MSCEHEHTHSHGSGNGDSHSHSHVAPIPTNQSQNLLLKIDTPHVTALNLANEKLDLAKVFKKPEDKYTLSPVIKSDCDEQLIVNIPFLNASVKLHSIIIRSNGDKYCPKTIKLWKNDTTIDFDNVEDKKPTYAIEHPQLGVMYNDGEDELPESIDNDDEFVEHYLPRHIFTGVQLLTLFIQDIYGDEDESHLHYIELRGEYTELSKDPVITLYELAANPADHKNLAVNKTANFSSI